MTQEHDARAAGTAGGDGSAEDGPEAAAPSVTREVEAIAAQAVGGPVDAAVVLVLRWVRRLWLPCLLVGLAWVLVVGNGQQASQLHLRTIPEILAALLSPFAGVVIAVGIRIVTTAIALVAALPAARADLRREDPRRRVVLRRAGDVVTLASGLRWLRFTTSARDAALSRLTPPFRSVAVVVDRGVTALTPLAALVLLVVLVVGPSHFRP